MKTLRNIKKYIYGNPIETNSVEEDVEECSSELPYLKCEPTETGYTFSYTLSENDGVYGLG